MVKYISVRGLEKLIHGIFVLSFKETDIAGELDFSIWWISVRSDSFNHFACIHLKKRQSESLRNISVSKKYSSINQLGSVGAKIVSVEQQLTSLPIEHHYRNLVDVMLFLEKKIDGRTRTLPNFGTELPICMLVICIADQSVSQSTEFNWNVLWSDLVRQYVLH